MKYFPKIFNLNGYKAIHWSKMTVGDIYEAKIKLKRKLIYPKGTVNYGRTKVQYETYFLVKDQRV